jgi:Xaa-Pro aminopeptidase
MNDMDTPDKIDALRRLMKTRQVAALIVPSADPHQSEYVAARWQARKWVSGFSGSAGTLVITGSRVGLWTDGRYFIQAERELRGSGIALFKSKEPGVPTVNEWILGHLKPGQIVAFDGSVYSLEAVRDMRKAFESRQIAVRYSEDLVGKLWRDRPGFPGNPAIDFPVRYAGLGRAQKLAIVRKQLEGKQADAFLLASLDDIAWLFNIRGNDISNSPVVLAYAVIERRKAYLFADATKFTKSLLAKLQAAGVVVRPYGAIRSHLKKMPARTALSLNPKRVNQWVADAIPKAVRRVEGPIDVTTDLKAVKNPVEQGHFRTAALLDGVALVKFFAWLDRALAVGERITEYEAGVRLASLRREAPECRDDSFNAICAYRGNAAMMHYSATSEASATLRRSGLFLVDSGGNYYEGTMDTTRTVALGPVSKTICRDYTLVLKGLIAFSRTRFLSGTTGTHLDAIARAPLWAEGLNYKCGSGHGVGSFLNVHEGPQGITPGWNPSALKPGMVVTIEPGVYVQGSHGIRTENMVLVMPDRTTEQGEFLRFETLTVCPIDTTPLNPALLSPDEREWLNAYHRRVWKLLSPRLAAPDRAWLKRKTAAI